MKEAVSKSGSTVSLRQLFTRFRWRILCTWFLVVLEAGLMLLFPLLLGIAIDGMLQKTYSGLYWLGGAGVLTVLVGAARRYYDTRVYSRIYASAAEQIVEQERNQNSAVSVISARTNMATELVEFLENSLPGIIDCVIGFVGALLMVWFLHAKVFASCLIATTLIVIIYTVTRKTTYTLNKGLNDESERRVDVLSSGKMPDVSAHFGNIVRWNIRLSDLETVNFSASWLVMIAILLFSVIATIQSGITAQGKVLSILMYVFGYIESVVAIPLFYQQFVRLQEISNRLGNSVGATDQPVTI